MKNNLKFIIGGFLIIIGLFIKDWILAVFSEPGTEVIQKVFVLIIFFAIEIAGLDLVFEALTKK